MAENYARENTDKTNNKGCGCGNKSENRAENAKTPMSKQNAAHRKAKG